MVAILSTDALLRLGNQFARATAFTPKEFDRARKSIARAAKTESKRVIASIYNLKQARVEKDLRIKENEAGVIVIGSKTTITLASYDWKKGAKGLRGRVIRTGGLKTKKGTFLARGFAGKAEGINLVSFFRAGPKRKMTAGRYAGKLRQPIESFHGPSIADALKDTRVSVPLRERILGRAGKELSRRLARLGGKR